MLVLTRSIKDAIVVDWDIKVTVLGVKGNAIRIDAPAHEHVQREELTPEVNDFRPALFEKHELAFSSSA